MSTEDVEMQSEPAATEIKQDPEVLEGDGVPTSVETKEEAAVP